MFIDKSVLLIIDAQRGFFENDPPVFDAKEILGRMVSVYERAKMRNVPVVFVRHDTDPAVDGPIHPDFTGHERYPAVGKTTPNAFYRTDLEAVLRETGHRTLYIMGFQTELCVDTTVRHAHYLDYSVHLIKDCHSTFDFPGNMISASRMVEYHNRLLSEFSTLIGLDALVQYG